jgi:hypothetical protein
MLALATLATLALIVLAGAVGAVAYRALRLPAGPATRQPSGSPEDDVDPVIAGPPQVPHGAGQSDSVRDWLCHYTHGRKTWGDAVAEFYRRAAADPQIASYFHGVDLPALQRHFTATIVIVTSKGLTAKTVVRMAEKHRGIRDRDGRPITSEVVRQGGHHVEGRAARHGRAERRDRRARGCGEAAASRDHHRLAATVRKPCEEFIDLGFQAIRVLVALAEDDVRERGDQQGLNRELQPLRLPDSRRRRPTETRASNPTAQTVVHARAWLH